MKEKINEWGVLQHCEKIEDGEDGVKKAEILSQLHCKKQERLIFRTCLETHISEPDVWYVLS